MLLMNLFYFLLWIYFKLQVDNVKVDQKLRI